MDKQQDILHVQGLRTSFFTDNGIVPAVDHIDFTIHKGEVLGIVGESGCGKSVTSLSIMGLLPQAGRIVDGEILFQGESLTKATEKRMRSIRGNEIAMIFQEPMTSLNPLFKIGNQLTEAIHTHQSCSKEKARKRSVEMLELVGLPRAEQLLNDYPHQLSGGMRQRVMIAMSMICEPQLLIADEPTTALDVTIQKQILQLMKELNKKLHTSIMMITHDLGVVAEVCDRVVVMYAGKIVEEAPVRTIFKHALHPYTKGLLASVPDIRSKKDRLQSIPGNVPKPGSIDKGCRFAERCEHAMERCFTEDPPLYKAEENQQVRCFLYDTEAKEESHETTTP
ncbi:peptide ABC transporter ATP-binding protein [Pontibacillus chungwhensis BH030062]|uniref:Peptide ABC transporter ATP-binding protein n=1 Tax=Pontibacillus chungwhensis BH030062 TaxID=1385513 RepID=A0A0A2UW55_9BACI|nr:ABC transporter ATP-binding protein [Pontibacillus chungwhensis]KGP90973.1 peptide ABC transporter ATP-binding protein [Pontibacillus chungwhensis BH030062]